MSTRNLGAYALAGTMFASGALAADEAKISITAENFNSSAMSRHELCRVMPQESNSVLAEKIVRFCEEADKGYEAYVAVKATCDRDKVVRDAENTLKSILEDWDYKKKSKEETASRDAVKGCEGTSFVDYQNAAIAAFKENFPQGLTFTMAIGQNDNVVTDNVYQFTLTPDEFDLYPSRNLSSGDICNVSKESASKPSNTMQAFCKLVDDVRKDYEAAKKTCERDGAILSAKTTLMAAENDWDYSKKSEEDSKNYQVKSECDSKAIQSYSVDVVDAHKKHLPTGMTFTISSP